LLEDPLALQEARNTGADPDSGNMPADDATSGETFEDAPDDLAGGSRSARSLDESITVIDYPEVSSEDAECRKHKVLLPLITISSCLISFVWFST
jgi:hypothetical protein